MSTTAYDRAALLVELSDLGFPSLADAVADGATLADCLTELVDCARTSDDDPDPAVYSRARALLAALYVPSRTN